MAGTAAEKVSKDSTSTAQNRFVVSLPKEIGEQIDRVGAKLAAALHKETGIGFELSRAQIVQALVRQALANDSTADDSTADDDGK